LTASRLEKRSDKGRRPSRLRLLMLAIPIAAIACMSFVPSGSAQERRSTLLASGPLAVFTHVSAPAVPSSPPAADAVPTWSSIESLGTLLNRASFDLNIWLGSTWRNIGPGSEASGRARAVEEAFGNLLLNWVNEPLTILGYAFAGRFDQSLIATHRFTINTFEGWGGLLDVATERGVALPRVDFGLAMCAWGVPGGPYAVIPVVGPRTLRDAFADVILTNTVLYAPLIPIIGLVPPVEAVLALILIEEVLALAIARQVDSITTAETEARGYDATRDLYLTERAARCEALRAL